MMLQEVRLRLVAVRDDVSALRVLVADPSEPLGGEVQPPPPPPRHPPSVEGEEGQGPEVTQLDVDIQPANTPIGVDEDDDMDFGS